MKIDINGVSITLTKEQLKEIDKQVKNIKTIDDINSYKDACDILGKLMLDESDFEDKEDWNNHQLRIIIKAVNFLDNDNKIWKADFLDKNVSKYINYFERKNSGWVFVCVDVRYCYSYFAVGFYFKNEVSAEIIGKRFLKLYDNVLG